MEFIAAPAFTRRLSDYLEDGEYSELQRKLASNPEAVNPMPGTGGF